MHREEVLEAINKVLQVRSFSETSRDASSISIFLLRCLAQQCLFHLVRDNSVSRRHRAPRPCRHTLSRDVIAEPERVVFTILFLLSDQNRKSSEQSVADCNDAACRTKKHTHTPSSLPCRGNPMTTKRTCVCFSAIRLASVHWFSRIQTTARSTVGSDAVPLGSAVDNQYHKISKHTHAHNFSGG